MRFLVFTAALVGASGCGGDSAAILEVRSDLEVPSELSAFCLAAYDNDGDGGAFARLYQFDDSLVGLPQTLTVEPGEAGSAVALVRGYRSGVEVARASARLSFDGTQDVALSLSRCPDGSGGSVGVAGSAALGGPGELAVSVGRGGSIVVAVGAAVAGRFRASETGLDALDGGLPEAPTSAPAFLLAFDADGDCDDDILIGDESLGASLWRREGEVFEVADSAFTGAPSTARAAAVADTDGDGDIDIVIGDATSLTLWKNDGLGRFSPAPAQLATDATTDITALAFAELDGNGSPELIVARGRESAAPIRVLAGQQSGALVQVDFAAPEVALSVVDLTVRDFDGDRADDVAIAVAGEPMRIFAGRGDGRLDDRSFAYFPGGAPNDVSAVATADWDGDCLADAIASSAGESETFRGSEAGFALETEGQLGSVSEFNDVDDDGDFDAILIDGEGEITWLAR